MTASTPSKDQIDIQMQERTAELEKTVQELRAEVIEHKRKEEALLQSDSDIKLFSTLLRKVFAS